MAVVKSESQETTTSGAVTATLWEAPSGGPDWCAEVTLTAIQTDTTNPDRMLWKTTALAHFDDNDMSWAIAQIDQTGTNNSGTASYEWDTGGTDNALRLRVTGEVSQDYAWHAQIKYWRPDHVND